MSFREAFGVWVRIALLSFGGPAGQIAVMHRILVDEKRWVSEPRFLHALNYCMLLPGPEAQQLVTYFGWLLHKTAGGLVAGVLFVLPGFVSILILSFLYTAFQDLVLVEALFFGIKAAVLAVVVEALLRIAKRILKNAYMYALAALAFVALLLFAVPFPLVIVAAAGIGFLGHRLQPARFAIASPHKAIVGDEARSVEDRVAFAADLERPTRVRTLAVAAIWLSLWLLPLLALTAYLGRGQVFTEIGWFFSKLAVVTFGGAYAVLGYMAQEAVENYGWLTPNEMLDGLGMAETTPGPLIQVVQFVAFMGAFRDPGTLSPYAAGVLASVLATWVTFVPCFLWIFLGAPYVERLRSHAALGAALGAVTAAIVGVILNLVVWFALHVMFAEVREIDAGALRLLVPVLTTLDPASLLITGAAMIALLRFQLGLFPVMAGAAGLGIAYHLLV